MEINYNNNTGIIRNAFNDAEMNNIRATCNLLSQEPKHINEDLFVNGFGKDDPRYPKFSTTIMPRFEHYFGTKLNLYQVRLLNSKEPLRLINDVDRGDTNPGMTILIPLHPTAPDQSFTRTVVFNQAEVSTEELENNAEHLQRTTLLHLSSSTLRKVSVKEIHNWEHSSAIWWDRRLLHCSDDFRLNDIAGKTALVLFTTNDNI